MNGIENEYRSRVEPWGRDLKWVVWEKVRREAIQVRVLAKDFPA
jgi:hypothetical protein